MIPNDVIDATPVMVANGTEEGAAVNTTANTTAATVRVVGGQKGAKKTITAELTGEFDGLWLKVWSNAKRGRLRELESGDTTQRDEIMAELVLDHNLTDEDGNPYPKPLTLDALDDMPLDLYSIVAQAVGEAIIAGTSLPKA